MENMKSLADQLREELVKPQVKAIRSRSAAPEKNLPRAQVAEKKTEIQPAVMQAILDYDNSLNKNMVHVRFDEKTVRIMNQFKMATQVDVTKLVAYAVKHLFDTCPELKSIIKKFIQNTDL